MPLPVPDGVDPKLIEICDVFMRFCYDLFGAYLDAVAGLNTIRQDLINRQNTKIAQLKDTQPEKATEEFMDQQVYDHRLEADEHSPVELLHRSTQGDFKRRTATGGPSARFLSQMLVAMLYGAWEDNYREKVALILGHANKDGLKSDLFQDISKLRHAIVHNQGIATEEVQNAKIIPLFRRGDEIYFSPDHAHQLLNHIDYYISGLCGLPVYEQQRD
jgi:hypothetical protein